MCRCLPISHRALFLSNTFTVRLIIPHEYAFIELQWSLFNLEGKCGCACPYFNSWNTRGGIVRHARMFGALQSFEGHKSQSTQLREIVEEGQWERGRETERYYLYSSSLLTINFVWINWSFFKMRPKAQTLSILSSYSFYWICWGKNLTNVQFLSPKAWFHRTHIINIDFFSYTFQFL